MKLYKKIVNSNKFSKIITVKNIHTERYKMYKQASGSCFVIDYEITIAPNTSLNTINIFYGNDDASAVIIEPACKGIEDYLDILATNEIRLDKVDILIEKGIIHPVDYHPRRLSTYTTKKVSEIFYEKGLKTYHRSTVDQKYNTEYIIENRSPVNFDIHNLNNEYKNPPVEQRIELPRINEVVVQLLQGTIYKKKLQVNSDGIAGVVVAVAGFETHRQPRHAVLRCHNDIASINCFLEINDALGKFISDCYQQQVDLGSFYIYILEVHPQTYLNIKLDLKNEFYWFLKNLFIRNSKVPCL